VGIIFSSLFLYLWLRNATFYVIVISTARDTENKLKGDIKMETYNELNETNSTIITWEGKELRTTQDPYVNDNGDMYTAPALDAQGNEYIIAWSVIDYETTDESTSCDWDNPAGITRLK
jgi:hypothetical protein